MTICYTEKEIPRTVSDKKQHHENCQSNKVFILSL